jgi:hypothetical protein
VLLTTPTPPPLPADDPAMLDHFIGPNWLDSWLLNAGTALFFIGALIELAFLIHYIRVAPAFKSWIGIMFVLRSTSFLLSGTAILLGRLLGPTYAIRPYLTFVLYGAVLASALVTYGTFLYERYKGDVTPKGSNRPLQFARRALGLRKKESDAHEDTGEQRPITRPLRIVKD